MNTISHIESHPTRSVQLEFLILLIPFTAIFSVVLICVSIAAIVSLATTGAFFGWLLTGSIPLWASILIWMVACLI